MKTLILLLIGSQLLQVRPLSMWEPAPEVNGQFSQVMQNGARIVYAHSYMSGTHLYDLEKGSEVIAYYSDGTQETLEVTDLLIAIAQGTDEAKADGNILLKANGHWRKVTQWIDTYSAPGQITFYTCYAAEHGLAVPTGRMIIQTKVKTLP